MIFSGILMYGAAQKNRAIGLAFFAVLFVYLLQGSLSPVFFAVNIAVIFLWSALLRRINCHTLSGASILVYSVIIDVICFCFLPLFPPNASLGAYIMAGLVFNLRSAVPAIALGFAVNVWAVLRTVFKNKTSRELSTAAAAAHSPC